MDDKISFECTIDEAAAVTLRAMELTGGLRKSKWSGFSISAALTALGFYALIPDADAKIYFAGLGAIVGGAVYLFTYKKSHLNHIRSLVVSQYDGEAPLRCEYEVSEAGLIYRAFGNETKFQWSSVAGTTETADSLDIVFRKPLSAGWIPRRAFKDVAQIKAWRDYLQMKIAAQAGNPGP